MLSALSTIPDEKVNVTYKMIKVYTLDISDTPYDYDSKDQTIIDKSHTQLFYNITNKTEDLSKCTPSYSRVVYRPNKKIDNLYWYSEALKSVPNSSKSGATTLWDIDPVKIKRSKILRKVKRPRVFSINSTEIGCRSVFEYGGGENEPKGYSGEISTPYDDSSVQRYRWVRYKDGSRWVLIARNDPNIHLAELRKTNVESEFDVVFLMSPPPGWRIGHLVSPNPDSSVQIAGRYPSVFSNPSTYRSSATSGFLSNRESSFSDGSNGTGGTGERFSAISGLSNRNKVSTYSNRNFSMIGGNIPKIDSDRYWHEFVLASTVTVQEEVNSIKRRLWKK